MKRKSMMCMLLIFIMSFTGTLAAPPGFSGGVNNEYEYEEYLFITGQPIKLIGTVDVSEKEKDTEKTVTYKYKLTSQDKSIKLDRTETFDTKYTKHSDKGQTVGNTKAGKYSEKIQIGPDRYELSDFQFSKSNIIDNRPASDFYLGDIKARKYYTINKDQGNVVIDITGKNTGYQNFWGNTETQVLDQVISYNRKVTVAGTNGGQNTTQDRSWQGTVRIQASDSTSKQLRFSSNEASFSSFNGGYMRVTNKEIVSQYDYDLPRIKDGVPEKDKRESKTLKLSKSFVPKIERLIVPKFRDTNGHWAQTHVEKLYSLDVFDATSQFFSPELPMTRLEFTKAVMKAANMRTALVEKKKTTSTKKKQVEQSLFKDLKVEDPNYIYVKDAVGKNIIKGSTIDLFAPNQPLTRAQAITILIRALGFESKAPNPGYATYFSDDYVIPDWARDSIYMAGEIGLVQGDAYNNVAPNKNMTRAEASALLIRFLEFLQKDLQTDYRENIINYN